ncbi:hypothetical protein [Halorussus caseinilyticus]|uniref:Transcriptional regulator n=1 Tax=Halorussus caseinilyticus TaxID=3034025 RepID=A0ABD5WL11_9EURY|nr:hypothetical protein [Halorussus sp. DT72]
METRTVEQVESWQTRPFTDGFAGLRELSDGEFSGAVRAGGAWLFMLNGRIIGVFEGSLDDFEDADGTAYAAPHPSLPLVFSMQERGGQTQAKYYTNDTPLSEVDSTLTSGKFTGYVELSENVLSGDYYVAYYGGRSMSVAFVGASEQVVTGDDAFERANDEVGIYEVRDVEIEVTDVPEPEEPDEPDETEGAASGGTDAATGGTGAGAPSGGASGSSGTDATPGGAGPADSPPEAGSPGGRADQSPGGQSAATRPPAGERPDETDRGDAAPKSESDARTSDAGASERTTPSADDPARADERRSGGASADSGVDAASAGEGVESTATPQSGPSVDATPDSASDGESDADGEGWPTKTCSRTKRSGAKPRLSPRWTPTGARDRPTRTGPERPRAGVRRRRGVGGLDGFGFGQRAVPDGEQVACDRDDASGRTSVGRRRGPHVGRAHRVVRSDARRVEGRVGRVR